MTNKITNPLYTELKCTKCFSTLGFIKRKYYKSLDVLCIKCTFEVLTIPEVRYQQ